MALLDHNKFYKDIENKNYNSLYFIFGEEPYLIEQCVNRFKFSILDENTIDFNFSLFYAGDSKIENVIDSIETLPIFSEKRLVLLKNAQDLKESEWLALDPLFKKPVDSTVFVIFADKIDKRKKSFKNLIDLSCAIEFKKPYENEIPRWINYLAQNLDLKISTPAVNRLHQLIGNNLFELESSLIQIKNYLNNSSQKIELETINTVISKTKTESVFDFTKAIGKKDRVQALEQLANLLDQGQSEIAIVSLLARHMRILMLVRSGLDQGFGGTKLANLAQISPYFIDEYCDQAKKWPLRKIQDNLSVLHETDRALKSSPLSSHIWLENLVLKSCSDGLS